MAKGKGFPREAMREQVLGLDLRAKEVTAGARRTHPRDDCYVAAVERRFAVLSWRSP